MISWRGQRIPGITLGTAQLGMDYGIANSEGQPDKDKALKIITVAWENGIRCFDTAQAYGTSESIIGEAIEHLGIGNDALVITKIDPKLKLATADKVEERIGESKNLLKVSNLFAVLLHDAESMRQWDKKFGPMLRDLKRRGEVLFSGVSIYDHNQFKMALSIEDIDIIQIPFNIFDQRGLYHHWFEMAKQADKYIFVRSVYLQGLLLMSPDSLSERMAYVKPTLQKYVELCNRENLTQKEMAMAFAYQHATASSIIVGAETPDQVQNNIELVIRLKGLTISKKIVNAFAGKGAENVFNPVLWPNS